MKQIKFKTNINCSGCVAKVTPFLNASEEIKSWSVDTAHPDKVLTVTTEQLSEEAVADMVRRAGFKAEGGIIL